MSMSRKNYQQMVKALASSAEHHVNNKRGFHVTCIAIAGQFFMDNIQFDFFKFYAALGEATANIEWRSACVGMMCPVCEVAMCPDCEVAGYTSDTATTKMLAQS